MQFFEYFLTDREILLQGLLEGYVKPLVEIIKRVEYLGHKEMQQRPQLSKIVLQRSACKKKTIMGFEVEKNLPSLGLEVFYVLGLVENHVIPAFSTENRMVGDCYFVTGNAYMEAVEFRPPFSLLFALLS